MTGMEKLLTRIKSLLAPNRAAEPSKGADVTPPPPTVAEITEVEEPYVAEPIAVLETRPADAESPTIVAEAAPVVVAEAPPLFEAAPTLRDEVPTLVEESPTELEPAPTGGLTLRLETERGSRPTFHVTKSGATIGRGPESTIQLADLSVSRRHARIAYKQGAYWLSDLGSMGGTWVDGAKLAAPRRVATGQTIDIGLCRLVVETAADGETTGAAKGPSNAA